MAATLSSKMIRDLLHSSTRRNIISDTGVYCIHFKNCKLRYIGETSKNIFKRLNEHWKDIKVGNLNNAQIITSILMLTRC